MSGLEHTGLTEGSITYRTKQKDGKLQTKGLTDTMEMNQKDYRGQGPEDMSYVAYFSSEIKQFWNRVRMFEECKVWEPAKLGSQCHWETQPANFLLQEEIAKCPSNHKVPAESQTGVKASTRPRSSHSFCGCNVNSGHGQMMDVETSYSEFISCDRTGRRNAVPDIKDEAASVGAGELTKDMSEMSLKPPEGEGPSETPPPEADGPRSEEAQAAENTS
ncbi:hypothetical protein Z043_107700 [Scleropages formosus]|uniref:cAMP-dependent protein kinase inhibitor gamma-like n=1 Tax=Scleropages formosus TaxID=113540 RepID=A0A0P7UW71_SCLFO|nr:hypothetical protein Z043_107700 [Scleropages formosus]